VFRCSSGDASDAGATGLLGSSFAWVYGLSAPLAEILDRFAEDSILGGLHAWRRLRGDRLSRNFCHLLFFRARRDSAKRFIFRRPCHWSAITMATKRARGRRPHQTSVLYARSEVASSRPDRAKYGWRWSFVVFGGLGILLGLSFEISDRAERAQGGPDNCRSQILREVWGTPTATC